MTGRSLAKVFLTIALLSVSLSLGGCGLFRGTSLARADLSERECLARVMYFESNRSSEDGMLAVGTVVMNRVKSPQFPKSVCGVVGQRNQFADGALSKPMTEKASRARAFRVADAVLSGRRHPGVGTNAMFFHTAGLTFPYRNMHYVVVAGGNAFYEKRSTKPTIPLTPIEPASPAIMVADARYTPRPETRPTPEPRSRYEVASFAPLPNPAPRIAPKPVLTPKPVVVASLVPPPRPSRPARAPQTIADLIVQTSNTNSGLGPIY
jgi:hypothetical protein